jgi:hypothetical protein
VAGSASPRLPNPLLRKRCRGGKPREAKPIHVIGGDSPACPEGAREAMRGVAASDGLRPAVRKGIPERRRNGLPGAPNLYRRYSPHQTSGSPRNPMRAGPAPARASRPQGRIRMTGEELNLD